MEIWCGSDGDDIEGESRNLVEKKKNEKKIGKVCHVIK